MVAARLRGADRSAHRVPRRFFSFLIGTIIGLVSGYYGGAVDTFASWLVNVVVAFPFYVLIIALVFVLVSGTRNIYIAIVLVGWVSYTRIIRGEVLVAKRREYVLAARSAGCPTHACSGATCCPT